MKIDCDLDLEFSGHHYNLETQSARPDTVKCHIPSIAAGLALAKELGSRFSPEGIRALGAFRPLGAFRVELVYRGFTFFAQDLGQISLDRLATLKRLMESLPS